MDAIVVRDLRRAYGPRELIASRPGGRLDAGRGHGGVAAPRRPDRTVSPVRAERVSGADLAFLAMDTGAVPEQFGAVLLLDRPVDATSIVRLLGERVPAVPRLRQRVRRTPPLCGGPLWADDGTFDVRRHVRRLACPAPGDRAALLSTVLALVTERLPRDRPLWRAALIDGLADGTTALALVVHHALADGLGGLAVLDALLDGHPRPPVRRFPQRPPPPSRLAVDAARDRLHALRTMPGALHRFRAAMSAAGGRAPEPGPPCSLLARTGPRRAAAAVHADLADVRRRARIHGGTVTTALLIAVADALGGVLAGRGEAVDAVLVAVPVAGRAAATAGDPGNRVSPLLMRVPVGGPPGPRIRQVTADIRARRALAAGPAPIAVLGAAFRVAATLGAYRWYGNRQRRVQTVVTSVRGPDRPVRLGGATVRALLPVVVGGPGNLTVTVQAASYAGDLAVTVVADPDRCPEFAAAAEAVRAGLAGC